MLSPDSTLFSQFSPSQMGEQNLKEFFSIFPFPAVWVSCYTIHLESEDWVNLSLYARISGMSYKKGGLSVEGWCERNCQGSCRRIWWNSQQPSESLEVTSSIWILRLSPGCFCTGSSLSYLCSFSQKACKVTIKGEPMSLWAEATRAYFLKK